MKPPPFEEVTARIARWPFPKNLDGIVGIAQGGVVPAALVAQHLGLGLRVLALSYRDGTNTPLFSAPRLVSDVPGLGGWKRVLLVDDFYMTGKSWHAARELLPKRVDVMPFVLTGDVDFALFRDAKSCAEWPWQAG